LTATLVPRGPAAAVVLDGEHVAAVGEGAKRFPVVATVNRYTWRTTVTRMRGEFLLGLNRAVRHARAAFDRLAYTHRNEYARWIDEAKRRRNA
jgi:hypothetical protein